MGKFTGVLLASDYDDTLYDHSFAVSRENRDAIDYFLREGGWFSISTGRSFGNFAIQMEREHLPVNAPVILANGAAIYDFASGKTLWQKSLPAMAPQHLIEICDAFPQVGFEAYHNEDVYTFRSNLITQRHLKRCHLIGLPSPIEAMPTPWLKVILQHMDTGYLQQVRDSLLSRWGQMYEATFSNPYLLELTAKGANKGLCVRWVADYLGAKPENIYCVGNGINDIPMLEVSAIPFAPADCYDEVKDWGAVLLPSCDESCVAALIRQLDQRYP